MTSAQTPASFARKLSHLARAACHEQREFGTTPHHSIAGEWALGPNAHSTAMQTKLSCSFVRSPCKCYPELNCMKRKKGGLNTAVVRTGGRDHGGRVRGTHPFFYLPQPMSNVSNIFPVAGVHPPVLVLNPTLPGRLWQTSCRPSYLSLLPPVGGWLSVLVSTLAPTAAQSRSFPQPLTRPLLPSRHPLTNTHCSHGVSIQH